MGNIVRIHVILSFPRFGGASKFIFNVVTESKLHSRLMLTPINLSDNLGIIILEFLINPKCRCVSNAGLPFLPICKLKIKFISMTFF